MVGQQDAAVRGDIYIDKGEVDSATLVILRSPLGLGEDGHLRLPGCSIPVHLKGAEPSGVVVAAGGGRLPQVVAGDEGIPVFFRKLGVFVEDPPIG